MPYLTTADGCRIYHEIHGSPGNAPKVVFLNGFTQTTINWKPFALRMKKRFKVVCYDLRGQGRSELGNRDLTLQRHAGDLLALVARLGEGACHLVGMSLGARVALAAAVRSPGQIGRLILCSAAGAPSEPGSVMVRSWLEILKAGGLDAMLWAMVPAVFGKTFLKSHGRMLGSIVKALSRRNRPEALEAQLKALAGYPANIELAGKNTSPTLVVSGTEDLLAPPPSARRLADACHARHCLLEGVGHSITAEAPDLLAHLVGAYLSETDFRQGPI